MTGSNVFRKKIGDPVWLEAFKTMKKIVDALELMGYSVKRSRGSSSGATVEIPPSRYSFMIYPHLGGYWSEKHGDQPISRKHMSAKMVLRRARELIREGFLRRRAL